MIQIVPYDASWPAAFEAEATSIRGAFGELALRVDHVGSTSVPGLAAKPVIDIQVSVPFLGPMSTYVNLLAGLGYIHITLGPFDLVYPFFQKPADWPCTHHVHLCVVGSELESRHLAFRDYLRRHPDVSDQYVELKRELAARNHGATLESRERYALSKTTFVDSVLSRVLSERSVSSRPVDHELDR